MALARKGGSRKNIKCWRRTTKSGGRYTVCSGSKGQKKRRSKRIRSQKKRKTSGKGASTKRRRTSRK